MESSIYVSTSAMRALSRQLEIVANNVANTSTAGFRAENVDFKGVVSNTFRQDVHYVTLGKAVSPSFEQGVPIETGNPLDVSISGTGWFAINTPGGIAYTRAGQLQISAVGELKSIEGHEILDIGGSPILLDPKAGSPQIHADGRIETNGRIVGNIGIFDLKPETISGRYTNTAFFSNLPPEPLIPGNNTKIMQGYLESSNVNSMKELGNLITINRTFEGVSSAVDKADQTIRQAIEQLSRR